MIDTTSAVTVKKDQTKKKIGSESSFSIISS